MLQKENFILSLIIGILLVITPISCDYPCSDYNMEYEFIEDDTFKQFGTYLPNFYKLRPVNSFLKKNYYVDTWNRYGWKAGYGNVKKQIDFKRNFEIGLRNLPFLDGLMEKGYTYGLVIVLGKFEANDYKINFASNYFVVNGLTKSFVIFFKFTENKISIYDCLEDYKICSERSTKDIKFKDIKLALNFHIKYDASLRTLYFYYNNNYYDTNWGTNLGSYSPVSLVDNLDRGYGYLGIAVNDYYHNVFVDLYDTYYCFNGGDKITPKDVYINYNGEKTRPGQEIVIPPLKTIQLIVEYKSPTEAKLMGPGYYVLDTKKYKDDDIKPVGSTYTFNIGFKDEYKDYDLVYHTDYNQYQFKIKVQSTTIKKLIYAYGKENTGKDDFIIEGEQRVLKYGSLKGDFDINELKDGYLYFHVKPLDDYNKYTDIYNVDEIRKELEDQSNLKITLEKVNDAKDKDPIYKVGVKVNEKGKYIFSSFYLEYPIVFYVKNLEPSKTNSKCYIQNSPKNAAFDSEQEVIYYCEFKDDNNQDIDVEDAKASINLQIETNLYRNDKPFSNNVKGSCKGNRCTYNFITDYNGRYQFETKFGIDTMEKVESTNIFYVSPNPTTLEGAFFYNYDKKEWVNIKDTESSEFIYNEKKENRDILLLIDLIDIRDKSPEKKKYSEIDFPYVNFKAEYIKGYIFEEHSEINKTLLFEEVKVDNKSYISANLISSNSQLRRSSLPYTIVLVFEIEHNIVLKYKLNINGYTACGRNVEINNSIINKISEQSIVADNSVKVAELMLRTDNEHLYNYFLDDQNIITFNETNYNCLETKKCEIEIVKSQIEGIYDLKFKSQKSGDFKLVAYDLKDEFNYFTVKVLPIPEAYYLEKYEPEEKNYIVEEDTKLGFLIKDKYGNLIDYDLPSDFFGLEYYLTVNRKEKTNPNIVLEKGDNCYYIRDKVTEAGNYYLKLKTQHSSIMYEYYKGPGYAYYRYSTINTLNSNKLNKNDISTVEVDLYDRYYNYINSDSIAFEREIQKVAIYAKNGNTKYEYRYSEGKLFTSEPIEKTGFYQIFGYINEDIIDFCYSCYFEVVYYGYDFSTSQLKMIGETVILMKKGSVYTLYEGLQRPAFEFDFLTEEGLPSNEIDPNTEINAVIIDENDFETKFEKKFWIDINKLLWVLPEDFELKKSTKYRININNENMNADYYLNIVEYGEDKSEQKYNLLNTFVLPNILYLKAGISDSFIVEFRDKNDLRYNQDLDLGKFNLNSDFNFETKTKLGNKKGQIIVEVKSIKTCEYSQNCVIHMRYDGEEINSDIQVVVNAGELDHFEVDKESISTDNILFPGEAGVESKINLIPFDSNGNIIKENIFDTKVFPEESFSKMFNLKNINGGKTSIKSKTNPVSYKIELSLSTEKKGTLFLSSRLFLNDTTYEMVIKPGRPSKNSVGYLEGETRNTPAGTDKKFIIVPKDKYGNRIIPEDGELEELVKRYKVKILDLDGTIIYNSIEPLYNRTTNTIDYAINYKKAQEIIIDAFCNDEEIIMNNNIINVVSGTPVLDNSKIIYNEKEYTLNDNLTLSLDSLPTIDLILYDKDGNKVDILDENNYEFKFINGENVLSKSMIFNDKLRLYIDESKIEDYFKLKREDNKAVLIIIFKKEDGKEEQQEINLHFSGLAPSKDSDKPVSFIINEDYLVLKAGEKGIIPITFYTEKGKPMGYFFDLTSEINVSTNDENVKTEIVPGKKYGTYNIIISSKKTTNGKIKIVIEAINKSRTFDIVIIPNKVNKCNLDEKLSPLTAQAGYPFGLTIKCVDEYDNVAVLKGGKFGASVKDPLDENVEYDFSEKDEESYVLYVTPTIVGPYTIKSNYLSENITFNTVPGDISPEYSYLEVNTNANAGELLDINIYIYDKYGNKIELKEEDKSIFDLYYRYKENSIYTDYKKVANEPVIKGNSIHYKQSVTKGGINEFRGVHPQTSTIIRCSNCEVEVNPSVLDLKESDVYKFNTFSKTYTKFKKYNDVVYNLEEDLLIKIYPKDSYGNKISTQLLEPTITVGNKELSQSDFNDEFIEFKGDVSELSGEKQLVIKNGDNSVAYTVFISGKEGFKDEEVDVDNTQLLNKNLEFVVNKYGYFTFELRNSNNVRYSKKFDGSIKVSSTDLEADIQVFNEQSSTVLVLVSSNHSNEFPNSGESSVTLNINEQPVFNLDLLINPGAINSAKINKGNPNLSISADKELIFSLIGYDLFGNKVLTNQNEVKLLVKNSKDEVSSYKSTFVDFRTGELNYIYELTLVDNYEINSGINNLFNETVYTIEVKPGDICPEKTLVETEGVFRAGEEVFATVKAKDKNNNDVTLKNEDVDNFKAYILDDEYTIIKPEKEFVLDSSSFRIITSLSRYGVYQLNINFLGRKIKSEKILVNPSICNVNNTLVYAKDKNGDYVHFDSDDNLYSSYNSPLDLLLVFRDDYLNRITNNRDIKISDAYLYGNNMKNLYWEYKDGQLYLDLENDENKKALEHLVSRSGEKAYSFTFTVKYDKDKKTFNLNVNHFSKNEDGDDIYGNGDYVLEKCEVNKKEAEFRAGSIYEILLTLRTEEGLIYNGEFNLNNINCDELRPDDDDKSFNCNVYLKTTGICAIQYSTTKLRSRENQIYNIIKLYDSKGTPEPREFPILLINVNGIPDKEKTEIIEGLPESIPEGELPNIIFTLKDSFGNDFDPKGIIDYLTFKNNDLPIVSNCKYDDSNKITATLMLSYPPKDINVQLYFEDKETGEYIELFPEVQKSKFKFNVDYDMTKVTSTNANSMKAGEYLDLKVYLYDKINECYDEEDLSSKLKVIVQGPLETSIDKKEYKFKKYEKEEDTCRIYYKIEIDEENNYVLTGTYSITIYAGEEEKQIASFTQSVVSEDIDINNFVVYFVNLEEKDYTEQNIPAGENLVFMVQAYDKYKNKIDHATLSPELFEIEIDSKSEFTLNKEISGAGALKCVFNSIKDGSFKFNYLYNKTPINVDNTKGPNVIIYVPGQCSVENPQIQYPSDEEVDISIPYKYTVNCLDKYKNEVKEGGAKFTSDIILSIPDSDTTINIDAKIVDNKDGSYTISFTPPLLGVYSIMTYLDGNKYDELMFNLTGRDCDGFICPNTGICETHPRNCIPPEIKCETDEQETKPFRCNGTDICVDSMTKCVPEGAQACEYMNALYPFYKDDPEDPYKKQYLCSFSLPIDCKRKYPDYKTICEDGICRKSIDLQPSQRVCPIGKVLCADLTCQDSIEKCYNDWPDCSDTQIRCPDQSCVDDQKNCPTTITCANPADVVCPDGTCVSNEMYCTKLKTCPEETPYLCTDYSCAVNPQSCTHNVACGHGKSLCSDLICRESC